MAAKKAISQHFVRQSSPTVSAKASDILRLFTKQSNADSEDQNWSTGVIYFKGYPASEINPIHAIEEQEIIGLCPAWLLYCQTMTIGTEVTLFRRSSTQTGYTVQKTQDDFFSQLQTLYAHQHFDLYRSLSLSTPDPRSHFRGGLAGYIGYQPDAHLNADELQPKTPNAFASDKNHITDASSLVAAMGYYDVFLKKEGDSWALYGPDDPQLSSIYSQINVCLSQANSVAQFKPTQQQQTTDTFQVIEPFKKVWQADDYQRAFSRIQQYLRAGDCYQVNLTQPFIAKVAGRLVDTLDALMSLTQAPYSGYMRVGDHELLSCSPELFLAFSGTNTTAVQPANQVVTRPIKGTFPRDSDPQLDLAYKNQLIHSEKDHSENLMIVDLLRNDLSKHAETGSVQVPVLFAVESFAQVHHLVSEIRATLNANATPLDVLLAALPGGSITGAPKKRAMEIIAELEAAPRGAYCGSFGYLNHDGSGQFNILIRTLQQHGPHLVAWAGGGITIASQLEAEYQECFDKISAILDCINQFQSK